MYEEKHVDIIREVVNIGVGEAAAALSDLVKSRVFIQVPDIRIMDAALVPDYLQNEVQNLGVHITQSFQGRVKGKSVLCYSREASVSLLEVLMGKRETLSLSESDMATLQEIGNLLLVSCLSGISNIIEDRFIFDMPHVTLNGRIQSFKNLVSDIMEFNQAVVIKTEMAVKHTKIRGYIFILLGFKELRSIIETLERKMLGN